MPSTYDKGFQKQQRDQVVLDELKAIRAELAQIKTTLAEVRAAVVKR